MNPDRQGVASLSVVCRRISPLFRVGSAKTPNHGLKCSDEVSPFGRGYVNR